MKVILLQDVAKIGRRFQVVNVPDGYAMNKLIPKRLAEPASAENLKRVEARAKLQAASQADTLTAFQTAAATLKEVVVTVAAETNAEGKLFQALKPKVIIDAVKEQTGVLLQDGWVQLAAAVKSSGMHTVLLSYGQAEGEFTINVVGK